MLVAIICRLQCLRVSIYVYKYACLPTACKLSYVSDQLCDVIHVITERLWDVCVGDCPFVRKKTGSRCYCHCRGGTSLPGNNDHIYNSNDNKRDIY